MPRRRKDMLVVLLDRGLDAAPRNWRNEGWVDVWILTSIFFFFLFCRLFKGEWFTVLKDFRYPFSNSSFLVQGCSVAWGVASSFYSFC